MIYCTILHGPQLEPAETFIEATQRFVCLPDLTNARLAVSVNRTAFMQVKVDDDVVLATDVSPTAKQFELTQLLTRQPKRQPKRSLFSFGRADKAMVNPGPAKIFTVIFRDGGPHDCVVATYEFHLLEAGVFTSRYSDHFNLVEGVKAMPFFTTDARSAQTALNCWNCESPVRLGDICKNCGCNQDNGQDEELVSG